LDDAHSPMRPMPSTELPEEVLLRIQEVSRRGVWDYGLAFSAVLCLSATVLTAVLETRQFQVNVEAPAPVFFGALALLLLLAWTLQDRTRRAYLAHFRSLAEMLQHRHGAERAFRDPLTGAYNRAALQDVSERFLKRVTRSQKDLSLVILDLDDFHSLNRRHGHAAGDTALIEFTQILHGSTRGSDIVARYGGDEFVLLLVETPIEGAQVVVRRIEERVAARNAQLVGGRVPLAFTAGAASFKHGMQFTDLFRDADFALLDSKALRPVSRATAAT
jgi:diguanylate cyclase (GGDEF)-like protein